MSSYGSNINVWRLAEKDSTKKSGIGAVNSYPISTVCFFSTGTKENDISQPPDMLNTSAIAHSKGLSMAFMLYFQQKF